MRRLNRRAAGWILAAAMTAAVLSSGAWAAEALPEESREEYNAAEGETAGAASTSYETADPVEPDRREESGQGDAEEAGITAPVTEEQAEREEKETEAEEEERTREDDPAGEPDWLCGGTGSRTDLSSEYQVRFKEVHWIYYKWYDLGDWETCTYDAVLNEDETITDLICADPQMFGYGLEDVLAGGVYEYDTPMLIKAAYYGTGPGSDVLRKIVEDVRGNGEGAQDIASIAAHIAVSQVYASLHEADPSMGSTKSAVGDGFIKTKPEVREIVNRFGQAIEELPVPDNYYVYVVATDDPEKQDFAYGSFKLEIPGEDALYLTKASAVPDLTDSSRCYSLAGAQYGIYTDPDCREEAGVLVTDGQGKTEPVQVKAGTYYVREIKAPEGFYIDRQVYEIEAEGKDKTLTVDVKDEPGACVPQIRIFKESRDKEEAAEKKKSLAGTEFTVDFFDGYYEPDDLPGQAAATWVIRTRDREEGCYAQLGEEDLVSGTLFKRGEEVVLPLGTFRIRETKAAPGYLADGDFGGSDVYVGQVVMNEEKDAAELHTLRGEPEIQNGAQLQFTVLDTPEKEKPKKKPVIGTSAVNRENGEHTAQAGRSVMIDDTVTYRELEGGREYVMEGRMIDRSTGEPAADEDGSEILAEVRFTADRSGNGKVTVPFTFRAPRSMEKRTIVAFERVRDAATGRIIAVHEDIEDEAQSIYFPAVRKGTATGDNSDLLLPVVSIFLFAAGIAAAASYGKKEK